MTSESAPVEQGQDFSTSIGAVEQKEMSEMSDISTENAATARSPTDKSMLHGVLFVFRTNQEHFGKLLPFTMGTVTCDVVETQEEGKDNDEIDDFESQVKSTHENNDSTKMETGFSDRFGVVRTYKRLLMEHNNQESL